MGNSWRTSSATGSISVDEQSLGISAGFGGNVWKTIGGIKDELTIAAGGDTFSMPLAGAKEKSISPFRSGTGAGFRIDLAGLGGADVRLVLLVVLDNQHAEVTVAANVQEGASSVVSLRWPGPMQGPEDKSTLFSAVPLKQGTLLPGDWDKAFRFSHNLNGGGAMYMPWWGQYGPEGGYLAIVQTVADAGVVLDHPAGGPTAIGVQWDASLGRFSYARSIKYAFQSPCDFVSLAKGYRQHVQSQGRFVSLAEKIARTPLLATLIGSPVIHTNILSHIQPESRYYKKDDPAANHRFVTFEDRADQLRRLQARGLTRAYVHLDGWGARGYDNLHPDCLPPCPEAGGWKGLRCLADTCHQLDYRLILHDQYRDYYHDAATFDPRHAIHDAGGKAPEWAIWFGGRQSVLCAALAYDYLRRNYDQIARQGARIDGAYLDVFASVDPDECYNDEHPMTRAQCMDHRGRCFGLIRARGGIISSEEPMDFAIGQIDLVHWGPYPVWPDLHGRGQPLGTPAPLLNLVYHDSLIVPWMLSNAPDSWGPAGDDGAAHAALNGAMPYLDIAADDAELARCQALCRLHKNVALQEMVNHELLDQAGRRRRTTFADGTVVEADLDSGQWSCPVLPECP